MRPSVGECVDTPFGFGVIEDWGVSDNKPMADVKLCNPLPNFPENEFVFLDEMTPCDTIKT